MDTRAPELHVSALSPAEFRAYRAYLELLALAQSREGHGLDADGSVRFDRAVVKEFLVDRLDVPRTLANDVLLRVAGSSAAARLAAGQVYAVFRLVAHAAPGSPTAGKRADTDLVFVPVDPLPLDPAPMGPPPAPPRRVSSLSVRGSSTNGARKRPSLPARARTPPSPPQRPSRQSLPAPPVDPFRDTTPANSPAKSRALSTGALSVGSNNPFRMMKEQADGEEEQTEKHVGPPLPPRKQSVRRPVLPQRVNSGVSAHERAESTSSSSTSAFLPQPTSRREASELMQQSLAAAAAVPQTRRESTIQVIQSSTISPPPRRKEPGRRDIINEVRAAVRESEKPPPPPQRVTSGRHVSGQSTPASPGPFSKAVEQTRKTYPNLKTWSAGGLLGDNRQLRTPFALIILNQPITRRDTLFRAWAASTLKLCADGGANRLYDALDAEERSAMLPSMIKGDLDSLRPEVRAYYASKGVAIKRDPSEYSTDLQKCIAEVENVEQTSGRRFSLLFLGGLSGRLDQTLHVLSVLFKLRGTRRETFVVSEESLAWVLDTGVHLIDIDHATMGPTCGILPVGVSEAFVRTEGLKWNLDWVTSVDGDLSTSNHLVPSEGAVLVDTSAPIVWTVEIRTGLSRPHIRGLEVDEATQGIDELDML